MESIYNAHTGKISIVNMKPEEVKMLVRIIETVQEHIVYKPEHSRYVLSADNFVMSFSKDEYKVIMSLF